MAVRYEHETRSAGNDQFSDYLNSLDEETTASSGDEKGYTPNLSDQVEQDLIDYQKKGFSSKTVSSAPKRTRRTRRRTSSIPFLGVMIGGLAALMIAFTAVRVITTVNREVYTYENMYEYDLDNDYSGYEDGYEYESPYEKLSEDIRTPEIVISDKYIHLPVTMNEFMENGWKIKSNVFSDDITEVGADPVSFGIQNEWGDDLCEISVVSPTGETVPLNEAVIVGLSISSNDYYYGELPGWVSLGSSVDSVEYALQDSGAEWTKRGDAEGVRYIVEADAENDYGFDKYTLRLNVDYDSVDRITMQLSRSQ